MTRGSHAPSLTTLVKRALRVGLTEDEKRAECTIVVAVSGGPDSMALLDALARLRAPERFEVRLRLFACGVDHGLRAEAEAELRLGAELAGRLGVPWVTRRVEVAPGASLQARAREARHRVLAEEAAATRASTTCIATAHHADDRAETFLLRLTRGAGLHGLAVLPVRDGPLLRPLLYARRDDILTHLTRHGIPFATDPSNANRRFARVRIREEVLPALLAIDPRIVEHIHQVCEELTHLRSSSTAPGPTVELPALGRRTRDALARLGPDAPRKMAVKLPKGRVATYDRATSKVVVQVEPPSGGEPSPQPSPQGRPSTPRSPLPPSDPTPPPDAAATPRKLP